MNLIGPIFYTHDIERAITFYKNLGLELEEVQGSRFARFAFSNGIKLGIKTTEKERERPGSQTTMVQVDNIQEVYEQIQSKNIDIQHTLVNEPWGKTFIASDPDGNWLEFIQ